MLSLFQFPEETCVDENDRQGPARSQVTMVSFTGEIVMIVRKPEKVILSPSPANIQPANIQMICLRLMSPLCWRAP